MGGFHGLLNDSLANSPYAQVISLCTAVITTLSLKHPTMAKSFQFRPSNSAVLSYYYSHMICRQDEGLYITLQISIDQPMTHGDMIPAFWNM